MKILPYLFVIACASVFFACTPGAVVVQQGSTPAAQNPRPRQPRPQQPQQPRVEATYQIFYDELENYGTWVDYPGYGYVWAPRVEMDFQPYSTNGHWVYSNDAWTWVSNYRWGWAAFHYGRWFYEDTYGWLWIPGNEWAPAWVTWGHSGNYYGWAPLGPRVRANDRWEPPANNWTFVPEQNIDRPDVHNYVVNKTNNTTIVRNVTIINNTTNVTNNNTTVVKNNNSNNTTTVNNNKTNVNNNTVNNNKTVNNNTNVNGNNNVVYNKGPQVTDVERVTNKKITQVDIDDDDKPEQAKVNNKKLKIYRPVISSDNDDNNNKTAGKPAPKKAEKPRPKNNNRP